MESKPKKRIYWDTCIFIDCLQDGKERYAHIKPYVEEACAGSLYIVTSTITYPEFYKIGVKAEEEDDFLKIKDFFDLTFIRRVPVDIQIGMRAQELCARYNVDFADSLHLASALETNTRVFFTYEGTLNKKRPLLELDNQIYFSDGGALHIVKPEIYTVELREQEIEEAIRKDRESGQEQLFT
jgi:predicted nucleic acid-binding protein